MKDERSAATPAACPDLSGCDVAKLLVFVFVLVLV